MVHEEGKRNYGFLQRGRLKCSTELAPECACYRTETTFGLLHWYVDVHPFHNRANLTAQSIQPGESENLPAEISYH